MSKKKITITISQRVASLLSTAIILIGFCVVLLSLLQAFGLTARTPDLKAALTRTLIGSAIMMVPGLVSFFFRSLADQ